MILGIDPGAEHVGLSIWRGKFDLIESRELTPWEFAHWWDGLAFERYDQVCAENYVPQGGFGNARTGMDTLKLLGYIEWTWRLTTGKDVILTTRLDRDAALTKLKARGWKFNVSSNHARDAQAVVVSALKWRVSDLLKPDA